MTTLTSSRTRQATGHRLVGAPRAILVPLDGSSLAQGALTVAAGLARATGACLGLVRAIFPVDPSSVSRAEAWLLAAAQQRAEREQARRALADIQSRLRADGLVVRTYARVGAAAEVILQTAALHQADLIIMSTHGQSGLGRWVYGSVTDAVVRGAPMPVVLVPATGARSWPADRPPRLLVPLDGSSLSEHVLTPAGQLAAALGAGVTLLQVVEPPPSGPFAHVPHLAAELRIQELETAREYLAGVARRLPPGVRSVRTQAVFGHKPARAIGRVADRERVDLIALASHGRGGLLRLVLGSVATELVGQATTPVLVVGPAILAASRSSSNPADASGQPCPAND